MNGQLVRLQPATEPWVTKQQLADHLGRSIRWVDLRVRDGMPSRQDKRGGRRFFQISKVEEWLKEYQERKQLTLEERISALESSMSLLLNQQKEANVGGI